MSMNLKPAIRYQLREYLVSCLVFWAINALLIGIGFLVLSLNLGSGDRSGYTYNGWGLSPDNLSQSFSLRFAARCLPLSGGRTAAVPGPVCR